jgi:hypothetical protein
MHPQLIDFCDPEGRHHELYCILDLASPLLDKLALSC